MRVIPVQVSAAQDVPNQIVAYFHCKLCIESLPIGQSPQSWTNYEVGGCEDGGIQIWCKRHDLNVYRIYPLALAEGEQQDQPVQLEPGERRGRES